MVALLYFALFLSRPSFRFLHYPTLIFIIKIIDFYLKIVV
nr:MAG TPA: TNF receptor-associated factor 3-interacting protein domain, interleukin 13 receptor [Caudoviricetes sp.]